MYASHTVRCLAKVKVNYSAVAGEGGNEVNSSIER